MISKSPSKEEKIQFIRENIATLSTLEIGISLGASDSTVRAWMRDCGINNPRRRGFSIGNKGGPGRTPGLVKIGGKFTKIPFHEFQKIAVARFNARNHEN